MSLEKTNLLLRDDLANERSRDTTKEETKFPVEPGKADFDLSSLDQSDIEKLNRLMNTMKKLRRACFWKTTKAWLIIDCQLLPIVVALYTIPGYQTSLKALEDHVRSLHKDVTRLISFNWMEKFIVGLTFLHVFSSVQDRDFSKTEFQDLIQALIHSLRDAGRALGPLPPPAGSYLTSLYVLPAETGVVELLQAYKDAPGVAVLLLHLCPLSCLVDPLHVSRELTKYL